MNKNDLAQKVRNLRNRKGFSQEELAERSELSLRTIQRIENGETIPRGDTLQRLANVFDVNPEEITDWTVIEDSSFLMGMNLSAITFIVFPLLGIIIPLILWISKKDRIKGVNKCAKSLINFEITWVIFFFIFNLMYFTINVFHIRRMGDISANIMRNPMRLYFIFVIVMYAYNLLSIIINTIRLNRRLSVKYFTKIRFIK